MDAVGLFVAIGEANGAVGETDGVSSLGTGDATEAGGRRSGISENMTAATATAPATVARAIPIRSAARGGCRAASGVGTAGSRCGAMAISVLLFYICQTRPKCSVWQADNFRSSLRLAPGDGHSADDECFSQGDDAVWPIHHHAG